MWAEQLIFDARQGEVRRFMGRKAVLGLAAFVVLVLVLVTMMSLQREETPPDQASAVPEDSAAQDDQWEQLEALGYVTPVVDDPVPDLQGVVLLDAQRASPGVNVYCSVEDTHAKFLDLRGELLHTIEFPGVGNGATCILEPDGQGHLLALSGQRLFKLDWDSSLIWESAVRHHHDVFAAPDGRIYTFVNRAGSIDASARSIPIIDQAIIVLDSNGRAQRETRLSNLFDAHASWTRRRQLNQVARARGVRRGRLAKPQNVFHINSIELLDQEIGVAGPGDALISLRSLDSVAIVDLEREKVLWSWGAEELDGPHHPSLLANGNILVLDNGRIRSYSRLVEVDPRTNEIVWQWQANPPTAFHTRFRGSVQMLPNGNLLVTESEKGKVFEITRSGELVWEFWNPDHLEDGGERKQIYRMWRMTPEEWTTLRGDRAIGQP
jgi:hypothetical protein